MTESTRRPARSVIQLGQPGDLIAAVPHLLGFHPANSLVVVGLRKPDARLLGLALRVDLPPPAPMSALAEQLCRPLREHDSVAVVIIVVGSTAGGRGGSGGGAVGAGEPYADLPAADLLTTCEDIFAGIGIPVVHRLWTSSTSRGARWRCYDEQRCTGILPDPQATPLAAASAVAGAVTYACREDIAATLAAEDARLLTRRAILLERASREAEPGPDPETRGAHRLRVVHEVIERAMGGDPALTDDDVVALTEALSDHLVRDACLVFDDVDQARAAVRVWTALVRGTPPPERAEAACLLAFHAYLAGDGVLAGIALDVASAADPGHVLTGLLCDALVTGLPPDRLRAAVEPATAEARLRLRGAPP